MSQRKALKTVKLVLQIRERLGMSLRRSSIQNSFDLNVITAREAVRAMIVEYKEIVSGLTNLPKENDQLIHELEVKFKCDPLVAELACLKADFKSLELALDFIYGHDP